MGRQKAAARNSRHDSAPSSSQDDSPRVDYESILESMGSIVFDVDTNGRVTYINRRAASALECDTADVLGKTFLDNFLPGSNDEDEDSTSSPRTIMDTHMQEVFSAAEHCVFRCATQTWGSPSSTLQILWSASARLDSARNVIGCILVGTDVTGEARQPTKTAAPAPTTAEALNDTSVRILERANVPVFGIDLDGKINMWNKKAVEVTQYAVDEVVGLDFVETFVAKAYRGAVGDVFTQALGGIERANFEFLMDTKVSGWQLKILLNATPQVDAAGAIVGVVAIGAVITDSFAQEQEYSRLIDKANAPIFGVDSNCCVNIWNRKVAEITQYTLEEVMGENLVEKFISEEYRQGVRHVLSQALRGDEAADFEVPLVTKTGRKVNISLNATARYDQMGQIVGVVGIGQDITDRIAQEQEYTRLIDTANAPIFGVDQNGLVNIWNKKAAEITQYSPQDVMGKNLVDGFITEDYRKAVGYVLSKALHGTETANFEFPLITKSGRRVEILLNATPRYNELGKVMGMVGIGQDITDRIAQEQEYTRLIDKANAPIFGVDADLRVNIWNRKAAEITQFSNDEAIGQNLVENFVSEEFRDAVAEVLSRALKGAETANFEFPLITKTERRVEILLNATPRYNELGDVIGVVGIGQDITDRIAQEQEYSRLIDTANAPIFGVDSNMRVNIWNRKAAQITHYSTAEVLGENLVETFITPEYRPGVAEVLSKALNGIQTANFEFPLITRPGTRIEILLNATPRNDLHGNIVGVVGIGQDITERISQEHEYFRLIDTANAPIFGVDTNGNINEWNQKIELITGYQKDTVFGMGLVDTFIIPESRNQVRQLLNQALVGIDVGEMELPMITKKGTYLLLLVNASSKQDIHGNIRGVIGVGQDYTARKQMEAAKVNFLASFSHELRTPLNGVLGMLELLKEQNLGKVPERYVHMAYVSGSLLLNLINDILDLSKIEAGHLEIQSAPFHIEDLLDYTVEIFKFKAHERGLKLSVVLANNVPEVVIGDVVRLRQILLNLLSNAIKFTLKGSITVKCSVAPTADQPATYKRLLFQVIDTGVGMDAEEKSRLFSLFTKIERTRKNNPTGSGLGLAICKQLVELMDGQIDVDSELGVGSVFFFSVAVRVVPEELLPKLAPSLEPKQANSVGGFSPSSRDPEVVVPKQARILVVEDNDFNWEVVKCFLHGDDHYLQWETNGRDAVNAYVGHHETFDLIFMDCEMPVMDGYAATQAIRQFEAENGLPRIPILGLTAYAMCGDREKCVDAGMDEFIVKPISKSGLLKAISYWMRKRYIPSLNLADPNLLLVHEGFSDLSNASPRNSADLEPPSDHYCTPTERKLNVNLLNASHHTQNLDLTRAISDLELEDPMMIGRHRVMPTYETPTTMASSIGDATSNSGGKPCNSSMFSLGVSSTSASNLRASLSSRSPIKMSTSPMSKTYAFDPKQQQQYQQTDTLGRRRPTSNSLPDVTKLNTDGPPEWPPWQDAAEKLQQQTSIPVMMNSAAGNSVLDIEIPEGDPVDYSTGVSQCGGNEELFLKLLEKYFVGLDVSVGKLEDAYAARDLQVLRREAHSLKGSSAYVAAMRVSKAAFRVQVAAEQLLGDQHDPTMYDQSFQLLIHELRALKGYLRRNFQFARPVSNAPRPSSETPKGTGPCQVM
ncbi:Aste57867_10730 [Aphanomyces stellatus]|uniref:histidine kinase n=1 Tax=Aphanomyces stellatus TaxID=120398 RepID=A0A485KRN8_9STRA|nr:hypothetical protein As57867_010690 [Aphanomyces stellatus]VFT87600.1 Aste57867_10730 [Aphanomyces stellatus]